MKKCEICGATNFVLQSDGWETTTEHCSRCGHRLLEKCSECGQMERIGRPFCEQEAKKIKKQLISIGCKQSNFINSVYSVVICVVYPLCSGIFLARIDAFWKTQKVLCIVVGTALSCAWVFLSDFISYMQGLREKKIKESRQAFLEANPDIKTKHELWWNWINSR